MLVVENTSLGLQTTARENLPLSVVSVFGRNFGATVLFTLNCTFALQCNPTWMRDNSGRNYKIAVNCLVCILDYILIQIRKVNGEKGYRFISIVSMTFFLKLRIESFPLCFVCTVSQHIFCCSACSNVLPNVLLLWFVLFFFSVNHGIQVGVGINFLWWTLFSNHQVSNSGHLLFCHRSLGDVLNLKVTW